MSKLSLGHCVSLLIGLNIGLLVSVIVKLRSTESCSSDKILQNERIVGGRKINIDSFPFVAAIVVLKNVRLPVDMLQCGCSIISKKWALSAAHCVKLLNQGKFPMNVIVIASNHKEWRKGIKHPLEKIIMNQHRKEGDKANDTSLWKVKTPFKFRNEVPIKLADVNYKYIENNTATVIGWGFNETDSNIIQNTLFGANVTIFSSEYCTDSYGDELTVDMICAGAYEGGRDACQMDSGGPLVADNVLIGIISWGGTCGDFREPGVYARVSYFHPWFKEVEAQEKELIGYTVINSTSKT